MQECVEIAMSFLKMKSFLNFFKYAGQECGDQGGHNRRTSTIDAANAPVVSNDNDDPHGEGDEDDNWVA